MGRSRRSNFPWFKQPRRKPRRQVRTVARPLLPGGIFRYEIWLDWPTLAGHPHQLEQAEELHQLLKRSAAGRWKVVHRTIYMGGLIWQRVIDRVYLERDSDAVLVKLCHTEPIYKVFRIVLPGEPERP